MIRVCEISIDNLKLKIGTMNKLQARTFIETVGSMLKRGEECSPEEWDKWASEKACQALNLADQQANWTIEKLEAEFDMAAIAFIYHQFREKSGLVTGGAKAA